MIHNPPPPLPPPRQPLQSNTWPWCCDAPCRRPPLSIFAVTPSCASDPSMGVMTLRPCVFCAHLMCTCFQLWHLGRQCTMLLQMSTCGHISLTVRQVTHLCECTAAGRGCTYTKTHRAFCGVFLCRHTLCLQTHQSLLGYTGRGCPRLLRALSSPTILRQHGSEGGGLGVR